MTYLMTYRVLLPESENVHYIKNINYNEDKINLKDTTKKIGTYSIQLLQEKLLLRFVFIGFIYTINY